MRQSKDIRRKVRIGFNLILPFLKFSWQPSLSPMIAIPECSTLLKGIKFNFLTAGGGGRSVSKEKTLTLRQRVVCILERGRKKASARSRSTGQVKTSSSVLDFILKVRKQLRGAKLRRGISTT